MKKDIRSHRDNHFEGMTVRKRVINLGDRSLPISNIASINVAESTPNLSLFVLAVFGAFVVLSTTGDFAFLAFINDFVILRFLIGFSLILPLLFMLFRQKLHLVITSNDGSKAFFSNDNILFLRQVKAALDEKINFNNMDAGFVVNFAESSIGQLAGDKTYNENIISDVFAPPLKDDVRDTSLPETQMEQVNLIPENVQENVPQTTWHESHDEHFSQTTPFSDDASFEQDKPEDPGFFNRSKDWIAQKTGATKELFTPAEHTHEGEPGQTFVPGKDPGNAQQTERPHSPFVPNAELGTPYRPTNRPTPDATIVQTDHKITGFQAQGPQVTDLNNGLDNNQTLTDYSLHIPRVETVRDGLNDPALKAKLDEMLQLMKDGTAKQQEKQQLKQYALDMAAFVQAYPPISRIFNDLIRVIGV